MLFTLDRVTHDGDPAPATHDGRGHNGDEEEQCAHLRNHLCDVVVLIFVETNRLFNRTKCTFVCCAEYLW